MIKEPVKFRSTCVMVELSSIVLFVYEKSVHRFYLRCFKFKTLALENIGFFCCCKFALKNVQFF